MIRQTFITIVLNAAKKAMRVVTRGFGRQRHNYGIFQYKTSIKSSCYRSLKHIYVHLFYHLPSYPITINKWTIKTFVRTNLSTIRIRVENTINESVGGIVYYRYFK